jgi:hypothetical protein
MEEEKAMTLQYNSDPFVSIRQQAERDAFEFRTRLIRWTIVAIIAFSAFGIWWAFR